jgi:hypothetical protein
MGMMVGGFFAAAAASSLSQIDVKPRTQHVKYFISTLIHISSLSAAAGSEALYVHGDDGSSFYRGKSPRPPLYSIH